MFAVITRAAALPEVTKNHDLQKNEYIVQLGQVKTISSFGIIMNALSLHSKLILGMIIPLFHSI
jgi:hypothetical protein